MRFNIDEAADHNETLTRAEEYIREALSLLRDEDVIPQLEAAIELQRIAMGEADPAAMDDAPVPCSCPPALVARGGWRSTCPEHGNGPHAHAS